MKRKKIKKKTTKKKDCSGYQKILGYEKENEKKMNKNRCYINLKCSS